MINLLRKYLPTYLIIGISGMPFLLNDQSLVVFFIFMLSRFLFLKKKLNTFEIFTLVTFILLFILQFFTFNNFSFNTLLGTILRMLTGLFYLKIEGRNFISKYVKVIRFICITSFIPYILFNLFPSLFEFIKHNAFNNWGGWKDTKSILIYQFSPINEVYRSIGPFWEGGVFALFINISIFFKFFILKHKFKNNLFEIIVLLTTISTTNYLIFFFLVLLYVNQVLNSKLKLLIMPTILIISVFIYFNTNFLHNKIVEQLSDSKVNTEESNEPRFVSIIRDFEEIKKTYLIGTGFFIENRFFYTPWRTNSNCGFTDIIVKLGLFGSIFYFVLLYRGVFNIFKCYFNIKGISYISNAFYIILLIASISEMIFPMSLFLGIVILGSSKSLIQFNKKK